MAKCSVCKKTTPDEMSFVVDKGICPYCGNEFLNSELLEEISQTLKKGFLLESEEKLKKSEWGEQLTNHIEAVIEDVTDALLDRFHIMIKTPESAKVDTNTAAQSLGKIKNQGPKKIARRNSDEDDAQGVNQPLISGSREGGGIPDTRLYEEVFEEDGDLYDSAVDQTFKSQGQEFVVMEDENEPSSKVEALKQKARQGEKFVKKNFNKRDTY